MKKTMLTAATLDRFEKMVNENSLTAEQIQSIEHLAYCANMGADSEEDAWERFTGLLLSFHNIDVKEPEKTAEEWAAESERVEAATLAALAPVLASDENMQSSDRLFTTTDAQSAQKEAQEASEKLTPYERIISKNPDCQNAWRLPGYPGPVYTVTYTDAAGGWWSTHFPSLREYQDEIERLRRTGARIEKTTKTEAGETVEIPAETRQEQTDRENWEHCQRISEELEEYAAGNVYKCPECGREHTWERIEETEHEDEAGWAVYTCPDCGTEAREEDWEQMSLYDFFSDCLDVEYRCGSDREYRSVCIMVACGGPNIYIDTAEKAVLLYWWTDRARHYISTDVAEAVDDWAREYWECI